MASASPPNVHISSHPCVQAKLSQLRARSTTSRETKQLIHDISLLVGTEALAHSLTVRESDTDTTPLSHPYTTHTISPSRICLVPILRSGLSMVDALQTLLPEPAPTYHLGLYREKTTLQPVEYYNNLPYLSSSSDPTTTTTTTTTSSASSSSSSWGNKGPAEVAILLDPIIATGATSSAAIDTLREWGVKRIVVVSVLGSRGGLEKASRTWTTEQGRQGETVSFFVGGVDEGTNEKGMIVPGLGDVGDRLFGTLGK